MIQAAISQSSGTSLTHDEAGSKLQNIHFACCNKISVMDMCAPLASELQELKRINDYDAALQEAVLVVALVMCAICDNPRHSEIMNHLGPSAKMYCRICMVRMRFTQFTYVPCSYMLLEGNLFTNILCWSWTLISTGNNYSNNK